VLKGKLRMVVAARRKPVWSGDRATRQVLLAVLVFLLVVATAAAASSITSRSSSSLSTREKEELAKAQAWVQSLAGLGVNIERSRIELLTYNNAPLYQSPEFCQWLKRQGVSWVRNVFGWSPSQDTIGIDGNPTRDMLTPYFEMIELLTNAGLYVRFDFLDVTEVANYSASGSYGPVWVNLSAAYAASYGFSHPEMIVFGAINEPADDGANGTTWNPYLIDAYKTLRQYLPASTWTLSMQHNYWNGPFHLNEATTNLPDFNVIYDCHYYPFNQPTLNGNAAVIAEWQGVAWAMGNWSLANQNIPLLLGEAGLWNSNDVDYGGGGQPNASEWAPAVIDMAIGAWQYRPAPWAITDSGDAGAPPINLDTGSSTAIWSSAVGSAFLNASAYILECDPVQVQVPSPSPVTPSPNRSSSASTLSLLVGSFLRFLVGC